MTMKGPATVWDRSALGTPADRSHLGLNFAGAPSTAQLRIGWKLVFLDAVQKLGGTEAVYNSVDTKDITFQSGVSFSLPLNRSRTTFKDIAVVGTKCSTLSEAESEASAAALQELQHGCLSMHVTDVSRIRSRELKNLCYELLGNAWQAYHAVKSVLSEWEDCMDKIEFCYSPPRPRAGENMHNRVQKQHSDIRPDVADQLAKMMRSYYLKLKELAGETEKVRRHIDATRERVDYFFCEPPSNQVNEHRGSLPAEIKLSMKLILQVMIMSLVWQWPSFKAGLSGLDLYVCELSLLPNHVHIGTVPKAPVITGPQSLSEEEAVENSCSSAISVLEREKSICMVNLNYNHRSHGELYVIEAKEAIQSASLMGSKILTKWTEMADEIQACEEYWKNQAREHLEGHQGNTLLKMTEAVGALHRACLVALQAANHGLRDHSVGKSRRKPVCNKYMEDH